MHNKLNALHERDVIATNVVDRQQDRIQTCMCVVSQLYVMVSEYLLPLHSIQIGHQMGIQSPGIAFSEAETECIGDLFCSCGTLDITSAT